MLPNQEALYLPNIRRDCESVLVPTAEPAYCEEEEDVEEESGRAKLQTAKKNAGGGGRFPLSVCLKADNLFSHVIYRKRGGRAFDGVPRPVPFPPPLRPPPGW